MTGLGIGEGAANTVAASLIGGTSSKLTGGKFANGAAWAAFASGMFRGSTDPAEAQQYTQEEIDAVSDAEWIFPEGRSNNLADYDQVQTNGILGDREEAIKLANKSRIPVFFNPSKGFVRDFVQSFAQKFGLGTDRMAKEFALSLGRAGRAMKITAHSQGTLTVANAAMLHGLPPGSTYHFKSPALSHLRSRAALGGTLQYSQPWGDGANLWAPSLNPLRWVTGSLDLLCGFCTHRENGL